MNEIKTADERILVAGAYSHDDLVFNTVTTSFAKFCATKDEISELRDRIKQLEQELEETKKASLAALKDQARYQWIRQCAQGTKQFHVVLTTAFEEMDEEIDDALSAIEESK